MKKIILALCVFGISIAFALTPRYGGTFVKQADADVISLDPGHTADGPSGDVQTVLYDTLTQFKYGTTEIEPGLATSWDISKDGLEYTFHLRKGVYFSKTKYFKKSSEFTSKDVVFSLKRQFDKSNPYHKVGGPFRYWLAMSMNHIIKDVIAVDKYTVKIILKRREAPIIADFAMPFTSILSKGYADLLLKKGKSDELSKKPVGTGPFIFKKWVKDSKIVVTANKHYWNKRPYLNRLIFEVIPESSVSEAALKTGATDLGRVNEQDIEALKKDPKFKVLEQLALEVVYIAFNTQKKPFDNVMVRRALSYAVNVKSILKSIYAGYQTKLNTPLPSIIWGYNDNLKGYEYNPKKAKELLKAAGYPNGFKTTLWVSQHATSSRQVAIAVQADLAKVGVKAKLVQYDWATYSQKISKGKHDMAFLVWLGDNGDPDNFLNILLSKKSASKIPSQNIAFWKNDEFSKLINEAEVITDIKKRTKLYKKAQEIFEKEDPWLMQSGGLRHAVMLKKVHGYKISPVGANKFNEVWLSK